MPVVPSFLQTVNSNCITISKHSFSLRLRSGASELHEGARANIPMYINEVGHANVYKRNVFAAVSGSDNLHYYAKVEKPMKQGDTDELLTD